MKGGKQVPDCKKEEVELEEKKIVTTVRKV